MRNLARNLGWLAGTALVASILLTYAASSDASVTAAILAVAAFWLGAALASAAWLAWARR